MLLLDPYHFCPLSSLSLHEMFPWLSLIFLKRSLAFPILLYFSISLHWSFKKAFLSLLAILWNSTFRGPTPSPGCLALGQWSHHRDYLGREDLFSQPTPSPRSSGCAGAGGPRGAIPCRRSGGAAVRRYPLSKVRSNGCALLEQLWRDTPTPKVRETQVRCKKPK